MFFVRVSVVSINLSIFCFLLGCRSSYLKKIASFFSHTLAIGTDEYKEISNESVYRETKNVYRVLKGNRSMEGVVKKKYVVKGTCNVNALG